MEDRTHPQGSAPALPAAVSPVAQMLGRRLVSETESCSLQVKQVTSVWEALVRKRQVFALGQGIGF